MAVRGSNLSRKAELLTVQAIKSLGTDFIQVTKKIIYFLLYFLVVLPIFTFMFSCTETSAYSCEHHAS